MRNTLIRIVYAVCLFFVAFILMEVFAGGSSTQTTQAMPDAELPLVYMEISAADDTDSSAVTSDGSSGTVFNILHGFTKEQDPGKMRPLLTPVSEDRTAGIRIESYDNTIVSAKAEVRTVGGDRLIEDGDISPERNADGSFSAHISFTNLIEPDTEYLLIIKLEISDSSGKNHTAEYMTRIRYTEDGAELEEAESALSFAGNFHDWTFDKTSQDNLLKWLEPDANASNNTLQRVTIYSSADQVTWGDLDPQVVTEPVFCITDIQNGNYAIRGSYYVSTEPLQDEDSRAEYLYHVMEYYELRQGTDRFYLMDYERTMDQVFDPGNAWGTDGELYLGIEDPSLQIVRSEDGDTTAFIVNGRLYEIQSSERMISYLFGFGDADTTDERDDYREHDIRILEVDNDGSADFTVYGYFNAGKHEGEIGIAFYHYSGTHHTIEEKAYVPYTGGWEVLREQILKSSYYDAEEDKYYLVLDDTMYEADINACTIRTVADNLAERNAVFSESGQIAAWETGEGDEEESGTITLLNHASQEQKVITADGSARAVPLGFLGEDLIYGIADPDDAVTDLVGTSMEPMRRICIVDADLNVLENYERDGYYVTGIEIQDNQITLIRVQKAQGEENSAGTLQSAYIPAADDQIVSSGQTETAEPAQTSRVSRYQTIVQLDTGDADLSSLRYIRPEEILYEGSRELAIRTDTDNTASGGDVTYYAWMCFGLISCESDIRDAIDDADGETTGVVTNAEGEYLWKGSSSERSEIDALTQMDGGAAMRNSLEVCIGAILTYNGSNADVEGQLAEGKTAIEILQDALSDADVLDLTGCTMDQVLYYVGQYIPVFALTGSGNAVLIVGYGPENIEIYDPAAGSVHLLTREAAETSFEAAGNRFVCAFQDANN